MSTKAKEIILIADAELKSRKKLAEKLEGLRYQIDTAASGKTALAKAKKVTPVVALIDLGLKDYSAERLLEEIKAVSPTVEVIFTGNQLSPEKVIEILNQGAFGYFPKPYKMDDLLSTVQIAAEKSISVQASETKFEDAQQVAKFGYYIFDIKSGQWTSSATLDEIFGIDEKYERDVSGWLEVVHPEFRQVMGDYLQEQILTQHKKFNKQYMVIHQATGEEKWVHGFGDLKFDDKGEPVEMFGIIQDITNRKRVEEALYESQRTISTLMGNLPGVAYRCKNDAEWTMEFISEGCEEILGYRPEDLINNLNLAFADLIHPDDRQKVWETIQTAVKDGEPYQVEYRIKTAAGVEKWVWEQGLGVNTMEGVKLEGFITDITERMRAEEALRESEAKYKAILEAQPDLLFELSEEGVHLDFYASDIQKLYLKPNDFIGKRVDEVLPAEIGELYHSHVQELLRTGKLQRFEYQLDFPEGPRYYDCRIVIYRERTVLAVVREITDQVIAREGLKKSEEQYRALFEDSNDAVVILDLEGKYVSANPKAAELFGYSSEELVGKRVEDFVAPYEYPDSQKVLTALKAGERIPPYERIFRHRDGTEFPSELTASVIFDPEGNPLYIQSIIRDISDRKKMEEQAQRQLKRMFALHEIDVAITSSLDIRPTLAVLLNQVTSQLEVDAPTVLLVD